MTALVQAEPCAAPEEEVAFCEATGDPNTYRLRCSSSTVPDTLCTLDHSGNVSSSAYCVRDHPHDPCVILCITVEAAETAARELARRLQTYKIRKGATEDECAVECASVLEARVLRRALLTVVHVLACSSVRIIKNTSDHEDSIIAHRCGQLAITGDGIESTATLRVQGRTALGRDLQFHTDEAVTPAYLDAPLVLMRGDQEIHAELYFTRGTPMEHAKYDSVAAPSYAPEVILSHAPSKEQRKRLHEYTISQKNVCARRDGKPCRIEVLRELLPEGHPNVAFGDKIVIGVESHGQISAVVCVQRALRAVLEECEALVAALRECDSASPGQASSDAMTD